MRTLDKPKIVMFAEGRVAISSMVDSLKNSYPDISIYYASAQDIIHNPWVLNENTLFFVMPGIMGEDCHYYDVLGDQGNENIIAYVESGGVYVGSCAGANYACTTIKYAPPWREDAKQQKGLALFNGHAYGPASPQSQQPTEDNPLNDVITVELSLHDGQLLRTAYGNGPALTNITDEYNLTVLARYKNVAGMPPSIAHTPFGKGMALFLGALPEISSTHGPQRPSTTPSAPHDHMRKIAQDLAPYEPARQKLWDTIIDVINIHNKKRSFSPCPA